MTVSGRDSYIDTKQRVVKNSLLAIISGLVLSIPFLNYDYYFFAWIGFVPLLYALDQSSLRLSYFYGLLAGFSTMASATYWMADFIVLSKNYNGYRALFLAIFFWLYQAQIFALASLALAWLRRSNRLTIFVLFPAVFIPVFSHFPMLFEYRLGDTQLEFKALLQAIEYTGTYGIDLVIMLFNLIVYKSLKAISKPKSHLNSFRLAPLAAPVLSMAFMASWLCYGYFSYDKWTTEVNEWPTAKVGIVQANEKPSLGHVPSPLGYTKAYPPEMAMTERLAEAGAELILWPEAKPKNYLDKPYIQRAYQQNLKQAGVSLIFQDIQQIQIGQTTPRKYNSAIIVNNEGEQLDTYQKIKRIPFGEYLPLVSDWPVVSDMFESFLGEFLEEMEPGTAFVRFEHETFPVLPLICFETTFPDFVAQAVHATHVDGSVKPVLVALSNNAWFGRSHQPYQHVIPSALRAIENRMPFIHAVNNGPSIMVLPNGDILEVGSFYETGGYLVNVPYSRADNTLSFYSRHPRFFLNTILLILGLIVLAKIYRSFSRN